MKRHKWYLSTWFISIWFTLSILIIPFVVGIILLVLQIKEEREWRDKFEKEGWGEVISLKEEKTRLEKERERAVKEKEFLESEIKSKKEDIVVLDDEALYQSFGFYEPKYDLENSEQYKNELKRIRELQKEMVKDKTATNHSENWRVDGSQKKGQQLNNNNIKLTIRSFNNECDNAIKNVKFNNVDAIEKRIKKAKDTLNRLNKHNKIEIKMEYVGLKLDELYLAYEYQVKKEEEKEEQRRIKEQMREEKRIQQEIEKEKKKLEKDEKHFRNALSQYEKQLKEADEALHIEIEQKIAEIKEKMTDIEEERKAVDYREQNAKAGYVYIISNIGSFGENVYKIGMTRRLEPMERVKELSDASVPFNFDVHAMIFSNDAPSLEHKLHKEFEKYQVNKINPRKEFFRVSLDEITQKVNENHDKTVEFTKLAEAEDYRKSLQLTKEEKDMVPA